MFAMRYSRSAKQHPFGPTQWMQVIWAANRIDPTMFGKPVLRKDDPRPGDYAEEYEHAVVFFPADDPITVQIAARTEHGSDVLKQAHEAWKKEAVQ